MQSTNPVREAIHCELAAELVRAHGQVRFSAQGSSMLPAIWPGDVLNVRFASMSTVSAGEVVVFVRSSSLFAHRVVRRGGAALITRGDAVPANDPPVTAAEFLGRVDTLVRNGCELPLVATLQPGQRVISFLLRQSELFTRAFLRLHALRRKLLSRAGIPSATSCGERI